MNNIKNQIENNKLILMDYTNSTHIFLYHCKKYHHYLELLIKYANTSLEYEPILTGTSNHLEPLNNSSYEKSFLFDKWDKASLAQSYGELYKALIDWIVSVLNEIDDSVVLTILLRCYIVNDISRISLSKQIDISDNTLNKRIRSEISKTITQDHIDNYNNLLLYNYHKIKDIR